MSAEERIIEKLDVLTTSLTRIDERMCHVIDKTDELTEKHVGLKNEIDSIKQELSEQKIELLKTKQELTLVNQEQTNKINNNNDFKALVSKFAWLGLTSLISVAITYWKMKS